MLPVRVDFPVARTRQFEPTLLLVIPSAMTCQPESG
jgi:hypothetical protein